MPRRVDTILLVLLAIGALAAAWSVPRLPDRLAPWAPLDVRAEPAPAVTALKLQHMKRDRAYCEAALRTSDFKHTAIPVLTSFRGCTVNDAIRIDARAPRFNAPFTASCSLSVGMAMFARHVVQPAALHYFNSSIKQINHLGTFACRHIVGAGKHASMSEHAAANAIDITGFVLADGRTITVSSYWKGDGPETKFLHEVRDGACPIFNTVLSPDFNAAHRTHFHLDMGRFKACR